VRFAFLLVVAMGAAMSLAWAARRRGASSGWIDAIWSATVGVSGLATTLAVCGLGERRAFVAALALFWSARLAVHIAARTRTGADDPRYVELERDWGPRAASRLWLFLQIQAVAGLVLVMAIALAAANPAPFPSPLDALGLTVFAAGWIGETAADAQLRAFARAKATRGGVCDVGLWRWSRHPNYVSEWLVWCGFALIALQSPSAFPLGLAALAAPALMYLLLAHVSGVPPLEAHMIESRGAAYRDYQRRVPAFFPRPRRFR